MHELQSIITAAFDRRAELDLTRPAPELRDAIETAIGMLDSGAARVAEKTAAGWVVNQWLKKAVLLYFGMSHEPAHRCRLHELLRQSAAQVRRPQRDRISPPAVFGSCRLRSPGAAPILPVVSCSCPPT